MTKPDISTWIAYNFWADERILATCEQITAEDFLREARPNPGWGSLRGILVHLLDAEYGWRSKLEAQDASEILAETDFADVTALRARWDVEHAAWLRYEAGLRETALSNNVGTNLNVWQTIFHVVNHGTQHRSEAAAILTGYGQSPGELDFDTFLIERPEYGG